MFILVLPGLLSAAPLRVQDDAGRELVLPDGPARRIVSLSPGATAMLFAAGAGDRIIATADYSVEPQAARAIPRIGDSQSVDLERILSLHPDVVVLWDGGNTTALAARLERSGLPVYRHRIERLDALPRSLARLGALTHTEETALAAARALRLRIEALQRRARPAQPPLTFIQVWDRPLYTVGGHQVLSDAIETCGYQNLYRDLQTAAPAVTLESTLNRQPEVILAVAPDARTGRSWLDRWALFPTLPAVRAHRLLAFVDQRLSRMGPASIDATEALCHDLDASALSSATSAGSVRAR